MKTELHSISKIFTERLLRIPDYQRGYAWTMKQLKEYWNDINQLEPGHNHYIGVLTLEDVQKEQYKNWVDDLWIIDSKNYEPHYIVDGQQRLTTTIILIQCILERIGNNEINYTTPDEIRKKFIYESKDKGISRSYLFGYEIDNPSYEFLKKIIFNEPSDNQTLLQETIYTNNLLNAKEYFKEQLKNLEVKTIEGIYTKITQHLLFNIYSMSDEIDVHVSFETMNNRGKPLSHLELLKNRLIYLSTKLESDEYERNKLRSAINECWKTVYHQLGRNKEKPLDDDIFLFNHFILFYGKSLDEEQTLNYRRMRRGFGAYYQDYLLEEKFTPKSLNAEGEEKLTLEELYSYVSSLKSSVEKWYEIANPQGSSLDPEIIFWLERINRMDISECLPLIMVSLQKESDKKTIIRFLKSLEGLLFSLMFMYRSYTIQFNFSQFVEWASSLSNSETNLEKLISKIDESRTEFSTNPRILKLVSEFLKESGFYRWRGLKYFMYEYEQDLKARSKVYTDKLNWSEFIGDDIRDHKTIEHIYPQNPRKECWKKHFSKYTSKERSTIRHTIGNLVPLSQPKNSSFQNKPFKEKVDNGNNSIGFKYGSFSEIEITSNSDWTAVEILKRSIKLLKFMEKRWGLDFGGTENMIKFLNLEFVLKKEGLVVENNAIKLKKQN